MLLNNPDNYILRIVSVTKIDTPPQSILTPPRAHHTMAFRVLGNGQIWTEDASYTMQTNDIISFPEGYRYRITSGWEQFIIVRFSLSGNKNQSFEFFRPNRPEKFEKAFTDLYDIWAHKFPGYHQRCMGLFYTILGDMELDASNPNVSRSYQNICNAVDYLHAHLDDAELSIGTLCQISNLCDTQFRKDFFKVYGTSPLKYIQDLRIEQAASLLTNTIIPVNEIAESCGFSDSRYFSTVFKKYKSKTPMEYRKSYDTFEQSNP